MSKSQSLQRFLAQAREKEKKYDWLGAVELHKKAADQLLKQKDFLKAGDIEERIGYCFHRAAMQARNQEEFKERIQRAVQACENAHGFYEQLGDEQKARMLRCRAVAKYLSYWLASDPSEKRKLLDDCLELESKALGFFLEVGDLLEYGRTYSDLSLVFFCRVFLEWDRQTLKGIVERGLEWGEKAVRALSEVGNSFENARAYFTLSTCLTFLGAPDVLGAFIAEPEEMEKNRSKAVNYLSKAVDLSKKVDDAYLLGLSHLWLGINTAGEESLRHFEKSLKYGTRTNDKFLIAGGMDFLAYDTYWAALAKEDPEKYEELAEKAMKFYGKAQDNYFIISFNTPRGGFIGPPAGYAEHYFIQATRETNPKKKLEFLEESEKAGMEALKLAEDSDMLNVISQVFHVVSKTIDARARLEPDLTKRRSRLEKALEYREKAIKITDQLTPFDYWDRGVYQNYLAGTMGELAYTEPDLETKRMLLERAVASEEKCLELCDKVMPYYERRGDITLFAALQGYQVIYAALVTRLYNLTNNPEHLRKAIKILQRAIESASKLDIVSLVAESNWKIAKAQDILGEHLEAAENFKRASESYMKAAEKIPQLKAFYQDYASYMKAWNEIEKAKHHHAEQRYGQAKEHYAKAANLHKSTQRWNYLGPNYMAWAKLEEAEDLSRREQTQEAKTLFQQAAELFMEAKKSIEAKLEKIEVTEEKTKAAKLVKASDIRHDYCLGRTALEEAKILDRQGDHSASSGKYALATEIFQKVADTLEHESDRQELRPIICLCRAWQMMTRAEAEASPELYLEASMLFAEAKEKSLDEKARGLALGHGSISKALEAGTRYEASREPEMYLTSKKHLEAAENYYLKAGFKAASEYARATIRLFDAYMYTHKAETETDPRTKKQYYEMAERLLQASAGSYMKAKHPEKSEQVQRLLESVKEKRQLATSLTEVLHAPSITSTTTSFITPTPTHEEAVGLEKFEHTIIEAQLSAFNEATVEEEVEIRLDLVNVARESGLLVRVDNLVPPSFKVTSPPPQFSVEDGSIDMKGRKLDPLKVETVKLSLKAAEPGVVNLSPQVIYVDELGKFRTSKVEPVAITVHPKLALEFRTKAAQNVFEYLVSSFVEDYMRRRLIVQEAGWRSFVQIIKNAKVSSRSVYGSRGHHGSAISELERRGLIETRIFLGERGRGGKIVKTRISYEKETVKRLVDQKVVKKE